MKTSLILTCEHYTNEVPAALVSAFKADEQVLLTHRAYDIGAAALYEALEPLSTYSLKADRSRLTIELNRSLMHPKLFSEFTNHVNVKLKDVLISYYIGYRSNVRIAIDKELKKGNRVLHVGVHSFTPELDGQKRDADIGLLYDPSRTWEKSFCAIWKKELLKADERLHVRFNYPYLGKADGFTTALRKDYDDTHYAGIEMEVNQAFFMKDMNAPLIKQIKDSLAAVLS